MAVDRLKGLIKHKTTDKDLSIREQMAKEWDIR